MTELTECSACPGKAQTESQKTGSGSSRIVPSDLGESLHIPGLRFSLLQMGVASLPCLLHRATVSVKMK
jgi:hypothetical protein